MTTAGGARFGILCPRSCTHADSRLLSGVAIRHADRKPCLRLPSVAPHFERRRSRRRFARGGLRASLTEKIVRWYRPELVIVAKSGLCPKRLFVTIAFVRSLWMCDTQKVEVPPSLNALEGTGSEAREREAAGGRQGKEGKSRKGNKVQGLEASQFSSFHRACVSSVGCWNAGGKLQIICSAALSIRKPLASARLPIKCGEVPSVGDSATLHKAAIAEIAEGKLASRFGALQDDQDHPEPEAEPPAATQCVHRLNSDYSSRAAKGLQTCCVIVDARNVHVVELKLGTASKVTKTLRSMSIILGCKYYTTCWCVSVHTVGNDPETVVVQLPLRTFKLFDVAAAALRDETNEVTKLKSIVLKTCVVQWSTLRQGIVVKTIRNNIKPKVATSRKPASPASSSAAASSSTDVPAVHDDDVFEVPEVLVGGRVRDGCPRRGAEMFGQGLASRRVRC